MLSLPTFPLRRRSNNVKPTTPTFLSEPDIPPPTNPVVYSPVPTCHASGAGHSPRTRRTYHQHVERSHCGWDLCRPRELRSASVGRWAEAGDSSKGSGKHGCEARRSLTLRKNEADSEGHFPREITARNPTPALGLDWCKNSLPPPSSLSKLHRAQHTTTTALISQSLLRMSEEPAGCCLIRTTHWPTCPGNPPAATLSTADCYQQA